MSRAGFVRVAFAVAVLIAAAVPASAPSRADDGADAFRAACQGCHANSARLARRNPGANAGSRQARWDAMLRTHHAPDPVQRALIVDFLERSR